MIILVSLQKDTPEKLQINGKFISLKTNCFKNKQKTNFEKLCEEISTNDENQLDQGIMENHLRELRIRKMNTKIKTEQIKKEVDDGIIMAPSQDNGEL